MTTRDRTVLIVLVSFVLVGASWFFLLAPVRKETKTLDDQIAVARARATTAQAAVAGGERARAGYRSDYAVVARLGKAVPVDDNVPSLVVQLQGAAQRARVDFRSVELAAVAAAPAAAVAPAVALGAAVKETSGSSGTTGATGATGAAGVVPATQVAAAALPPGAAVGPAGFPSMPFDFAFTGSFFKLQDFLGRLDRFTRVRGDQISVRGRLLTVDGFALNASPKGFPLMQASVHATAYLLPADEGLAAGSTAGGPAPVALPAAAAGGPSVPTASATATGVGAP